MAIRTAVLASLISVVAQGSVATHAQTTHGDRALNYLLGQWYTEKGRVIEFYITRDIPKFSDAAGPSNTYVGSYRAGEGGADYVLEYPFGLKCFYNVRTGSGSDFKEIVLALRNAIPEKDGEICIQGALHRQADTR